MGIISNISLPSNYLHYYWKNAQESDSYNYVVRRMSETKQTILSRQFTKGKTALLRQYGASGAFSQEDLAVLDARLTDFRIRDIGDEMNAASDNQINGVDSADTSQMLDAWFKLRETLKDGDDFERRLNDLSKELRNNTSGLVRQIENYIIANYQTVQTQVPQSEALTAMVKALLAKPNGTLRKVNPADAQLASFTKGTQRFILLLYALGSDIDTSSKEAIENSIRRMSNSLANTIQGDLGETARLTIGTMNNALAGTAFSRLNQQLQTRLTGGKMWSAKMKVDPAMADMLQQAQNNMGTSQMQFKGNMIIFSATQQKSDKEIVTDMNVTIGGIQTKTSGKFNINDEVGSINSSEMLKLQDNTSLMIALARHLGFQGKTIQRLMQIAVADPQGNSTLDAYWEGLRRQVTYGMLSDALIGYGDQTKNLVIQFNNTFVLMEDFFTSLLQYINDTDVNKVHAKGFPSRDVFTSMNEWNTSKTASPNRYAGILRSKSLYPQVLNALYNAKITIRLNTFFMSGLSMF